MCKDKRAGRFRVFNYSIDFFVIIHKQSSFFVANGTEMKLKGVKRVHDCANNCQKSSKCDLWTLDTTNQICTLKKADSFLPIEVEPEIGLKSGFKNECFFKP